MKNLLTLIMGASLLTSSLPSAAAETPRQYIQVAQIEIYPQEVQSYKGAVRDQIEAAIRLEPGVLTLYSVSDKNDPTHVTVFEIYRDGDAYRAHLQSDHFRKYKAATAKMVKSLKLIPVDPIMMGAQRSAAPKSN